MKLRISGTVEIRNEDYDLVEDVNTAKQFDGLRYTEEEMCDYIGDGTDEEQYAAIGLTGGFIELRFNPSDNRLWVITEYDSPRALTDDERTFLIDYTQGQWSDGMGPNMEIPSADEQGLIIEMYATDQTIKFEQA